MTKLPSLSSKEVIKALRSAGFENAPKRGKGSHIALEILGDVVDIK